MTLSNDFLIEKDKDETQPVDLYEIDPNALRFPSPLYFANSRLKVIYAGVTYLPLAIQRSAISKTSDGSANRVSLQLDDIGHEFISLSQSYRLSGIECNIKQVFRNLLTSGNHRHIINGQFSNPHFSPNGRSFNVDVIQHIYSLQRYLPFRTYQRQCNSKFGDEACITYKNIADSGTTTRLDDLTLDRNFDYAGNDFYLGGTLTIISGTNEGQVRIISASGPGSLYWTTPMPAPIDATSQYTVIFIAFKSISDTVATSGTTTSFTRGPSEPIDFWKYGVVHFTSGSNISAKRRIASSGESIVWDLALPYPVAAGTTYQLSRGCDKTYNCCKDFHCNEPNFSGFLYFSEAQNLRRYGQ